MRGSRRTMEPLDNDRWRPPFKLDQIGRYEFFVSGWVDHWRTWVHDLQKRVDAGQDVTVDLRIGAQLVDGGGRSCDRAQTRRRSRKLAASADVRQQALERGARSPVERYPDLLAGTTQDADAGRRGRSRTRPLQRLVRAVPALGVAGPQAPRHVRRRHRPARLRQGAGLRRPLPAAHLARSAGSSARAPTTSPSQSMADPGVPWAIGAAGRRSHLGSPRARRRWPTSSGWSTRRDARASRLRSTSRSRRRPTIPG